MATLDEYLAAEQRAQTLLLSLLSIEQLTCFKLHGYFFITGSAGGEYAIHYGYSGNIVQLCSCPDCLQKNLTPRERYKSSRCAYLPTVENGFPISDHMIAQMLTIMVDEKQFLQTAY